MQAENNTQQADMAQKKLGSLSHPLQIKVQQHPPSQFTINETYMIRKQSLTHSNDLIVRRLNRCFQRIKKLKSVHREKQLFEQYDIDKCDIRRDFKKINEIYNLGSKTRQIRDKKIEKMKARIQRAKQQVNQDEIVLTRQVDVSKLYLKNIKPGSSQKHT